jgi:phage gp36-like protein
MAQPLAVQLVPATSISAPGSGTPIDLGTLRRALRIDARVSAFTPDAAATGPQLTLTLETSAQPTGPWRVADTLTITGAGNVALNAGGLDQHVRVSWALAELAAATFAVSGVAHVTYCDPADLLKVVPEHSIEELPAGQRADACITGTDLADGYVGAAYVLPLQAWGEDLRLQTARLAAWQLFEGRGVDPGGPDKVVMDARDNAEKWLDRLANGRLSPPGIIDSTPEEFDGGSFVVSSGPPRGW